MLQVRKEKLGDRITALQQLVSPFGKVSDPGLNLVNGPALPRLRIILEAENFRVQYPMQ